VDSGVYAGWNVPLEYDPLLAKLIGYGDTREQAIARLRRALQEYFVGGVKTNLALFERILSNPEFSAGEADTGLLARMASPQTVASDLDENERAVAAIAAGIFQMIESRVGNVSTAGAPSQTSAWKTVSRMEGLQ
jgi:acetyl-CoA carboxylase biotin carboxylase subunit